MPEPLLLAIVSTLIGVPLGYAVYYLLKRSNGA